MHQLSLSRDRLLCGTLFLGYCWQSWSFVAPTARWPTRSFSHVPPLPFPPSMGEHYLPTLHESFFSVDGKQSQKNLLDGELTFGVATVNRTTTQTDNLNQGDSSEVLDAPSQKDSSSLTVRKILRFSLSAMGIWLCGPLLSLIDTSVVGMVSGTTPQAALNPAVAVTDYSARLMVLSRIDACPQTQ